MLGAGLRRAGWDLIGSYAILCGCGPAAAERDQLGDVWGSGFRIDGERDAFAGRAARVLPDIDRDGMAELYVSERSIDDAFVVWGRRGNGVVHLDRNVGDDALRMPGVLTCQGAVDIDGDTRVDLDCHVDNGGDVIVLGSGEREQEIVAADAVATGRIVPLPGRREVPLVDPLHRTEYLHQWVGDVNADGYVDLWLEQRDYGPEVSGVYDLDISWELVLSTPDGITSDSARFDVDTSSAAHPLGDLDGDGVDDFAVRLSCSLPNDDETATCATVRVVFGGSNITDPDWRTWPGFTIRPSPGLDIRGVVGSGCDVTGDGMSDVLVRVRDFDDSSWQDSVALLAGSRRTGDITALELLSGEHGFEVREGTAEMVGDLDEDGRCDLRMTVWEDPRAAIVWGRDGGEPVLWSELERGVGGVMMLSPFDDASLQFAAEGRGDLTGDEVPDLAFLFERHDKPYENSGVVLVVSGAAIGALRED